MYTVHTHRHSLHIYICTQVCYIHWLHFCRFNLLQIKDYFPCSDQHALFYAFYIRNMNILRFWYPQGVLEPIPVGVKGQLYTHTHTCSHMHTIHVNTDMHALKHMHISNVQTHMDIRHTHNTRVYTHAHNTHKHTTCICREDMFTWTTACTHKACIHIHSNTCTCTQSLPSREVTRALADIAPPCFVHESSSVRPS